MLYDFDIIVVDTDSKPLRLTPCFNKTTRAARQKRGQVARFRHQETADAAAAAPAAVRLFLEHLGFDFKATLNAMPAGQYERNNDALRLELIARMDNLLANRALKKALKRAAKNSGFDTTAFIACAITAKPSHHVVPRRPDQLVPRSHQDHCR